MVTDLHQKCLDKLENLIDIDHVRKTSELQKHACAFEKVDHIPAWIDYKISTEEWPDYRFDEIFQNPEKMLMQELRGIYLGAKLQDDRLYGIRANYGTGIIASLFGCQTRIFEDSLPIALHTSSHQLSQILESQEIDINSGLMSRVFETAAYFRQVLSKYPKLSKTIGSEMFDIQGPFDNASMVWGSDIFYAFYDDPQKISLMLELITKVIVRCVKRLREIDGCPISENDGAWNHLGGLCIRLDSCINLNAKQYTSVVKPFDQCLLEEFGGWIHFCGKANHWWRSLLDIPGLKGINPYQGEFYDLYEMHAECESTRIPIVQWTTPLDARCRERIKTGLSRSITVENFEDACRLKDILYSTGHADI
jgi:hypothetical protein